MVVSLGLVGAAFVTVAHAGCDTPAQLITAPDGVVHLIGGCVTAAELVVPGRPVAPGQAPPPSEPALRP